MLIFPELSVTNFVASFAFATYFIDGVTSSSVVSFIFALPTTFVAYPSLSLVIESPVALIFIYPFPYDDFMANSTFFSNIFWLS